MYVCMCVFTCMCTCMQCSWMPEEGVGSPELEFADVDEQLDVNSRNQIWVL